MRGATHFAIGANAIWIPAALGVTSQWWILFVAGFAALLPDLDAHESVIKNLDVRGIKPFAPIAFIFSTLFRHRGALHSLFFLILVACFSFLLLPYTNLAFVLMIPLGYASHLIADGITKSGIEFFWPVRTNIHFFPKWLRVTTGKAFDWMLQIIAWVGIFGYLFTVAKVTG